MDATAKRCGRALLLGLCMLVANTATLAANQSPSFSLGGNPVHPVTSVGEQQWSGFAFDISPGPSADAGQQVRFEVSVESDLGAIVDAVSIDANGELRYRLTGAQGEARLQVVAVDDGGRQGGGIDRSAPQHFYIAVGAGSDLQLSLRRAAPLPGPADPAAVDAEYLLELRNQGPLPVQGVTVSLAPVEGLADVVWACSVPDDVCSINAGQGSVETAVNLPVGSVATVNLYGRWQASSRFVVLRAELPNPAAQPRMLRFDDQRELVDPIDPRSIFRGGFE